MPATSDVPRAVTEDYLPAQLLPSLHASTTAPMDSLPAQLFPMAVCRFNNCTNGSQIAAKEEE
eukprot:3875061-Amphidinium_carterae.1